MYYFCILTEKASSVSRGLENISVVQGEDAVFTCELMKANSTVKWAKEGKAIKKSHKYVTSQEDRVVKLTVHNASVQDSGEYSCEVVGGATTKATLEIKGLVHVLHPASHFSKGSYIHITNCLIFAEPIHKFVKVLKDSHAEEASSVTLVCETAQTPSTVTWLKGHAELKHGGRYEMSQKEQIMTLTIKQLEEKDTDLYTCNVGTAKSMAKLTVNGKNIWIHCMNVHVGHMLRALQWFYRTQHRSRPFRDIHHSIVRGIGPQYGFACEGFRFFPTHVAFHALAVDDCSTLFLKPIVTNSMRYFSFTS